MLAHQLERREQRTKSNKHKLTGKWLHIPWNPIAPVLHRHEIKEERTLMFRTVLGPHKVPGQFHFRPNNSSEAFCSHASL